MKQFLLSPLKHQAKVFSVISLLLVAAWYALIVLASVDSWNQTTNDFKKWESGQGARCESLFEKAEEEIAAIEQRRCEYGVDLYAFRQCQETSNRRKAQLVQTLAESDCPSIVLPSFREYPVLAPSRPPGPLPIYALESRGLHLPVLPAAFVGVTLALLLLGDFAKRVLNDGHKGWKRLTLVASVLCGAAVTGWLLHEGEDGGESLVLGLAALSIAGATLVYGQLVFRWVADGFSAEGAGAVRSVPAEIMVAPAEASPQSSSTPATTVSEPATVRQSNDVLVLARYWPRVWARCVDLTLCWLAGSVVLAIMPSLTAMFPGLAGIVVELVVGMLVLCSTVFLYEWLFICKFGATPGKMMFGITVRTPEGDLPSSAAARKRAWVFLYSGLYLCFYVPIFQITGAVVAWYRRNELQPWDVAARTSTSQKQIGMARLAAFGVLAFCMFVAMVGVSKVAKEVTKSEVRRSVLR